MEIPTVLPPAPHPEEHVFEMQVHSNSGGGDEVAQTGMVICDPSCMNPAKSEVVGKVIRWSTYSIPAERGRQIDRHWPDHHYRDNAGMQERHLRDDGVVGGIVSKDGYTHLCQVSDT